MKGLYFLILGFLITLVIPTTAQENKLRFSKDQLADKNYKYLAQKYYELINDPDKASPFANAYLIKALNQNDSVEIAKAYYILSSISPDLEKLNFLDCSISYIFNKSDKHLPSLAYIQKGNYFYKKRNFYLALENYLKATEYLDSENNIELDFFLKNRIALLKSRFGNDKEALILFKEVYNYYEDKNYLENEEAFYFPIIFALADSYYRNKKIDSADYYIRKGYVEAKNNPSYRNYFTFEKGIIEYYKGNYESSIDSLSKSLPGIWKKKDFPNIAYSNFFLGKSHMALNNVDKAIGFFKRVDSICHVQRDVHPDLRETYVHLINFYKKKEDKTNQLYYVQRLLNVDSILHSNYKMVSNKFLTDYDTPKLLKEKNGLIVKLKNNINAVSHWFNILSVAFVILFFISLILYFKRKMDVLKFQAILENSYLEKQKKSVQPINNETVKPDFNLPSEIIEPLLEKLNNFENDHGFLKQKLKIYDLAKSLGTNSKYLSMVINENRNKNFSQYINDLRIDYVIERLREDSKFRKYTVKAISEEMGFSNPESFSKAFHKKTKLYPSFFINELQKMSE